MITAALKFPTPSRFGYGTIGKVKRTKVVFSPPSRYVQQTNYCYRISGSDETSITAFPKTLRYIRHCRYRYDATGNEQTAITALPKTLRYKLKLPCSYKSDGHEYNTFVLFQKPLRCIQQLYYSCQSDGNEYTVPLVLNPVRNFRHGKILYRYDTKQFYHVKLKFRYDHKNIVGTKLLLTFDRLTRVETKWLWKHSVLVRSGWRIMARDTATGNVSELGFIDAENPERALSNVELPDGDYEIFVLTSSLFWKDCQDRNRRMIAIRPDTEISPLPVIDNLRSSISQGTTLIEWSTNQCDIDDCLFAIWYSSETPVDTTRQPDFTTSYHSSRTEYRTTFQQKEPSYVTMAAMRPGKEPEYGAFHKLFLDWNSTPPMAPDDVLVLHPPLTAVDQNIDVVLPNDPNITRWV